MPSLGSVEMRSGAISRGHTPVAFHGLSAERRLDSTLILTPSLDPFAKALVQGRWGRAPSGLDSRLKSRRRFPNANFGLVRLRRSLAAQPARFDLTSLAT